MSESGAFAREAIDPWEIIKEAAELGDYESLVSAETLRALVSIQSFTDRTRAEQMLLGAASKIQKKTAVQSVIRAALQEHVRTLRRKDARQTEYSDLPQGVEGGLYCGQFEATDAGIYLHEYADNGNISKTRVCSHPLLPTAYLEGIEDGLQHVNLAFRRGDAWRTITVERAKLASRQTIVGLSAYGVDVTTETGRHLVQYLSDIESANEQRIPRRQSIDRLGWVTGPADEEGRGMPVLNFSPYIDNICFTGTDAFRDLFSSVRTQGSFKEWLRVMEPVYAHGGVARLILAASFAAPIVGLLRGLPFFLHTWGSTEGGKTVSLMMAASIWGDPDLGRLVRSFNSTGVGMELLASFLHNLPVCLDELQTARDQCGNFDETIYMLGEGQGKTRGKSDGGMRRVQRWHTVFLTNGEQPITASNSGGGAKNRVLEAELGDTPLFADPRKVAETVRQHFGHAGKRFIETLRHMGTQSVQALYNHALEDVKRVSDSSDKQNLAAAYLLAADRIASDSVFQGAAMVPCAVLSVLSSREEIDVFQRALEHVRAWVAMNPHRFTEGNAYETELWGRRQSYGALAIVGAKLDEELTRAGFSYKAFLAAADRRGILEKDTNGKRTKLVRIGSVTPGNTPVRCVVLQENLGQTRL